MTDGAIRNQPCCRACRSRSSERHNRDTSRPEEAVAEREGTGEKVLDAGTLAAQVMAALHGGRR